MVITAPEIIKLFTITKKWKRMCGSEWVLSYKVRADIKTKSLLASTMVCVFRSISNQESNTGHGGNQTGDVGDMVLIPGVFHIPKIAKTTFFPLPQSYMLYSDSCVKDPPLSILVLPSISQIFTLIFDKNRT